MGVGAPPCQEPMPIALRGFARQLNKLAPRKPVNNPMPAGIAPSDWHLVFDTETTVDPAQRLRLGAYHLRRGDNLEEAGLFYDLDAMGKDEIDTLTQYAAARSLKALTLQAFVEEIFYGVAYDLGATIIGFNLPFDLSRLAFGHGSARGAMRGGFTFALSQDKRRPRVQVRHLSSRAALIRFAAPARQFTPRGMRKRERTPIRRGYFVDIKTLAAALVSQKHSLASLCEFLQTENRKLRTESHDKVLTPEYLAYAVRDVQATWECFVELRKRFTSHSLKRTPIHAVYSEASLGKAYLRDMGVQPFQKAQPDFPLEMLGIVLSTYYGGRSEVHLRRTSEQVAYCDFLSMYPTVCSLMNLWRWVIAEGVDFREAATEARVFLERVELADLQCPDAWPHLCVLVQVLPSEDVFPVRARYGDERQYTIGLNHLSSGTPIWCTMADCVAAKLLTGRSPKVVRALAFSPRDVQKGLCRVAIAGNATYTIDPETDDFYRRLIDLRTSVKIQMKETGRAEFRTLDSQQLALKILANATSYGIFVELNVNELDGPADVRCFGGSRSGYAARTRQIEEPGPYFHPLLATFITGAARLMLSITERLIGDAGLDRAFCDTDSMAIAKPPRMENPVFLAAVRSIQDWFTPLNPYAVKEPLLKIERVNFHHKNASAPCPLYCLAVSSKRYVLFNLDSRKRPLLRKASAHGLGHLLAPYRDDGAPHGLPCPIIPLSELGVERWQHDLWHRIIAATLRGDSDTTNPARLPSFDKPAASRYAATSPRLLRWFAKYNESRPYLDQVRPFNFMLSFQSSRRDVGASDADNMLPAKFSFRGLGRMPQPVAPYRSDPQEAVSQCFDRGIGAPMRVEQLKTYAEVLAQYHLHPEAKFLSGDFTDKGPTARRHVRAIATYFIGKEANRWEEQHHLGLDTDAQVDYGLDPEHRVRLLFELHAAADTVGRRRLANEAGISLQHLQAVLSKTSTASDEALALLSCAATRLRQASECVDTEDRSFLARLAAACRQNGLRQVAIRIGIDPANLSKVLSGRRKPSRALLEKLRVRMSWT